MTRPEATLVALLRSRAGRVVPYAILIERLWPGEDYPAAHARQHLRELAYRVRSIFEDETGEMVIAVVINRGYVWTGQT